MSSPVWKRTRKTAASEEVMSTTGVIFGGVEIEGGTLGTVTFRTVAAGTAFYVIDISGGNFNAGPFRLLMTERGITLTGLTVEFSSTMDGNILWLPGTAL